MPPVRRILCETLTELLEAVREHAEEHNSFELADDVTEKHFGFQCMKCNVWWSAPVATKMGSMGFVREVFDSLKGRQRELGNLEAIHEKINYREMMYQEVYRPDPPRPPPPKPKKPPENAWEHLMAEDKS